MNNLINTRELLLAQGPWMSRPMLLLNSPSNLRIKVSLIGAKTWVSFKLTIRLTHSLLVRIRSLVTACHAKKLF
jgi:hypothetical protein